MTSLRLCVTFKGCQDDYYDLAMKARPFSPFLQRITFMEPEHKTGPCGPEIDLTLLVPPDMVNRWASIDETIPMEYMGEEIVYLEIIRTCRREGLLTLDELYG